jgi:hypothetical protein
MPCGLSPFARTAFFLKTALDAAGYLLLRHVCDFSGQPPTDPQDPKQDPEILDKRMLRGYTIANLHLEREGKMFKSKGLARAMALVVILLGAFIVACGGGGDGGGDPDQAGDSDLIGTWNIVSVNGEDAAGYNLTLTISSTTYTVVRDDCTEEGIYVTTGSQITTTVTSTEGIDCDPVGEISTMEYEISRTTLTITDDEGDIYVFEKSS